MILAAGAFALLLIGVATGGAKTKTSTTSNGKVLHLNGFDVAETDAIAQIQGWVKADPHFCQIADENRRQVPELAIVAKSNPKFEPPIITPTTGEGNPGHRKRAFDLILWQCGLANKP